MRAKQEFFKEIHGDIVPGGIYSGENCKAFIFVNKQYTPCDLWAISPLGCELVYERKLSLGESVKIKISTREQEISFNSIVVAVSTKDSINKYGIRWIIKSEPALEQERSSRRWLCGLEYAPTISCPNPIKYNDLMIFKATDVSKDGFKLITSLRNRFIFPKVKLNATVNFPMTGIVAVQLEVMWAQPVEIDGKANLSVGVKFSKNNPRLLALIGEYLSQFGPEYDAVPKNIRDAGLIVPSVAKGIEFRYVRTEEEYLDVLALRYFCYHKKASKDKSTIFEMSDNIDTRSRIIIGLKGKEVIASARISFHQPEDRLEQADHVDLPNDFPRNDEPVEMTRVCVHSNHRAADLLLNVVSQATLVAVQNGRKWLVGSSPENLVHVYKRFGAQVRTDLGYDHELIVGQKTYVIMFDLSKLVLGIGISPFYWNILTDGGKLVAYLSDAGHVTLSPTAKMLVKSFSLGHPLAKFLFKQKMLSSQTKK